VAVLRTAELGRDLPLPKSWWQLNRDYEHTLHHTAASLGIDIILFLRLSIEAAAAEGTNPNE
jgi:hypothetical protein